MSLAKTLRLGGKEVAVPVTVVDQLVNFFDPEQGRKRYRARLAMALSGGYTGADRSRRANQAPIPREMDADSAVLPDLAALREESQHIARNNAIASGALKTNITKVVGTGLKVKAQIDRQVLNLTDEQADQWERQAERQFRLATETRELDAERMLPFSLLQGLVFLRVLEDGDLLVNLPRFSRPGSAYSLHLQLIEAARLCNPQLAADTVSLAGGVEKDGYGAAIKYHVCNQHPGNWRLRQNRDSLRWTTLAAFGPRSGDPLVLHLFDKTRPNQTRGVPYLAPVVELLKQLGKYTDAEVMAAVVSGMLTVFVRNAEGNPELGDDLSEEQDATDTSSMSLGSGTIVGLGPGEDISTVAPGRPNVAFDPFVMAILRQVGVALELPFEILIKHFTASYSAARAALEEAWGYFNRRRHWLATSLCQPVYEAVITEAVATGRLAAPGFFADPLIRQAWLGTMWTGDAASQLDPLKEINAAAKRVELTISTLDEESRRLTGTPWEDKLPQTLKERAILRANGVSITALDQLAVDHPDPPDSDLEPDQ